MQTCQNNLSSSLYAMLFVCHMVPTSDKWMKSRMKVSTDIGMLPLNKEVIFIDYQTSELQCNY